MNRLRAFAAGVFLLAVVAGCSEQVPIRRTGTGPRRLVGLPGRGLASGSGEQLDLGGKGSVPDDFLPTSVVQCVRTIATTPTARSIG